MKEKNKKFRSYVMEWGGLSVADYLLETSGQFTSRKVIFISARSVQQAVIQFAFKFVFLRAPLDTP